MKGSKDTEPERCLKAMRDFCITLLLWAYFTLGFVCLFSPFYCFAGIFAKDREQAFQRLNCRFYGGFFLLARSLMPGHRWRIDRQVLNIRSSVIVCNHRSYLDPLLLISFYQRHNTIVKSRLFSIPLFGWMIKWSGYIPSAPDGRLAELMVRQLESIDDLLAGGGNLFIFPEGTRSRNGRIGRLNKGAFKIARRCRAPIEVVFIKNTHKIFRPGFFSFETVGPNTVTVKRLGRIEAAAWAENRSLTDIMARVRRLLETGNRPAAAAGQKAPEGSCL